MGQLFKRFNYARWWENLFMDMMQVCLFRKYSLVEKSLSVFECHIIYEKFWDYNECINQSDLWASTSCSQFPPQVMGLISLLLVTVPCPNWVGPVRLCRLSQSPCTALMACNCLLARQTVACHWSCARVAVGKLQTQIQRFQALKGIQIPDRLLNFLDIDFK